jgi:tetratricopeptide (TPR) repeat protein
MRSIFCIAASIVMVASGSLQAANYCGELTNAYGPFDYRKRSEHVDNFNVVESAHFTPEVENGIKGNTGLIGGDLDYTLRAIPNHHRALAALARVALRDKVVKLPGTKYPVECYFERASRFMPDDGAVLAAYGNYMFSTGQPDKALAMYQQAAALEPENATINYNLGLTYFKKKEFEQANKYAKKAYALGFPLPGLKNKLIEAGQWDDKQLEPQDDKQQ